MRWLSPAWQRGQAWSGRWHLSARARCCCTAGLFAALILLWRDPAVGTRLGTMVAARRSVLRAR